MAAMRMVCGSTLTLLTFVFFSLLFSRLRLGVVFGVSVVRLELGLG